ncbi:coiled-coil and C2 domain-containing protein 1-like isoform X2 [Cephus cinctus]|uniref:Coiled-coil and C2 domain-containing protein 1-like isoform X2 n=1 Tax=Cephus cinctus TaxID=211228 RepID=A0AAJ7FTJ5_CEPCN|nr:coiled-coil and C2 domain-containing protein 1-like isoform X2 [Cephus cinctus]
MFGKKKEVKRRPRPAGSLAQYGLFEIPDNIDDIAAISTDDGHDHDLEAELAALTSNNDSERPRRRKAPKPIPNENLDAMVAESMKDIDLDAELSGDDDDDPDLLNELKEITGDESVSPEPSEEEQSHMEEKNDSDTTELITLLQERLAMYKTAEKKAKNENEAGRARRFARGVKTLEGMLADTHSGKVVNKADMPPVLPPSAVESSDNGPTENKTDELTTPAESIVPEETPVPEAPQAVTVDPKKLELLKKRQQEYKTAAVAWKKSGNVQEALQHVKLAKQFDIVIASLIAGEDIDLSDMPPSPNLPSTGTIAASPPVTEKEESEAQKGAQTEVSEPVQHQAKETTDIGTALKERLEVYRRTKTTAEEEGNSSKARRYGRICKQFEDALKLHSRGKPIPIDELPTPPGFPPLSMGPPASPAKPDIPPPQPEPKSQSELVPESTPSGEESDKKSPDKKAPPVPPRSKLVNKQKRVTSRADKQMMQLQQRQHELKQAALAAKNDGDLDLAKDYLRQAKGLDPLIEASKSGLPVDMDSVPLSPLAKMQLQVNGIDPKEDDFTLISADNCTEEAAGTDQQIYDNLEAQLIKQIKWCLSTRDHSKALGDVAGYNRWERLALGYTRDLDMLRVRKRDALPPPQHHYEIKTYAIVQSCTDLGDSDLELSIIRGVNYVREADTYVMFEFPYPSDNPPSDRTSTVRDTNNPEYEAVFPLSGVVDRTSRQCQRAFKRHAVKCQVWAKGCSMNPILCCTHPRGFFRSDSLLGTVTVKLQPLETQCILHDSFPLMEGRKAVGGKLEVKLRVRNPILTKQIEQITDKWLTIDH